MSSTRVFAPDVNVSPKTYSASAGNTWSTTRPPRVPQGAPSTGSQRVLRHVFGVRVGVVDGASAGLADREPGDGARRVEIGLEQRRRQRLRIGDVVEVGAHLVERQPVAGVDLEAQQVANRLRVLGPVEALEGPAPRVGGGAGGLVELVLEGLDENTEVGLVGPARSRRRHHARPQLADHRLGDLGVVGRRRRVEAFQRQVAAKRPVVVTAGAGAAHDAFGVVADRRGLAGRAAPGAGAAAANIASPPATARKRAHNPFKGGSSYLHQFPVDAVQSSPAAARIQDGASRALIRPTILRAVSPVFAHILRRDGQWCSACPKRSGLVL